jgi:hypothetical protein
MEKELAFNQLNKLIEDLESIDLFPSLVWLWSWDIIVSFKKNEDHAFETSLEDVWKRIWENIDKIDWSLTYGDEAIYEQIRDWLITEGFMTDLDSQEDEDGND